MNRKILFLITFLMVTKAEAQFSRYVIRFKDKSGNGFSLASPSQYLSQRAIERRNRYNIAIDSTDLPITSRYIDSVRLSGNVTLLNQSKWLNQIAIQTTDMAALAIINSLPFVSSVTPIASRNANGNRNKFSDNFLSDMMDEEESNAQKTLSNHYNYGRSNGQIKIHQGEFLHNHGFRGQGMQVAVIDAGFFNYNTLPTFDSLRNDNRILGTWDFVNNESSVSEDDAHGMHCLSTIASNLPGVFVGTAPQSSFYLFRSEDASTEYPIEEHNMAAAAEKADSLGVDLCTISLGYSQFDDPAFDYTYNDLNGHTTISAKAINIASKKGMLMVAAAGNEGNNSWHYLITPADADSVMAVGAVDTAGNVASFSSYGPSSDGQIKPSVAAVGRNAVVANNFTGQPNFGSGTSYATPIMAGITTCLWQAFPEVNNMEIINTLEQSASQYNRPDNRKGYGIPDAKKAFVMLQKKTLHSTENFIDCKAKLDIYIKADSSMALTIERKYPESSDYAALTTVSATGGFEEKHFHYEDDLSAGFHPEIDYRYKMSIGSDTSYYADTIHFTYNINCQDIVPPSLLFELFPNPVYDWVQLKIGTPAEDDFNLLIYNALGQMISEEKFHQNAGTKIKNIEIKSLPKGVYFIKLMNSKNTSISRKMIRG